MKIMMEKENLLIIKLFLVEFNILKKKILKICGHFFFAFAAQAQSFTVGIASMFGVSVFLALFRP